MINPIVYYPPLPPMQPYPAAPMQPFYRGAPMPTVLPAPMPPFYQAAPMQPIVPRHAIIRHEPGTSVYVRGLADDVDDNKLKEEFQTYGTIVDAKVIILTALFISKLIRKTVLIFFL